MAVSVAVGLMVAGCIDGTGPISSRPLTGASLASTTTVPYGASAGSGSTLWLDVGWTISAFEFPVSYGCCDQMDKALQSPDFPEPGEPIRDGVYAIHVSGHLENPPALQIEVWRWVSCETQPDRCVPPISEGDAYIDSTRSLFIVLPLDETLVVIVAGAHLDFDESHPIYIGLPNVISRGPTQVVGNGAAFARLVSHADRACRWEQDPSEAEGMVVVEDGVWEGVDLLLCRGPMGLYLTSVEWKPTLEIRDGSPMLWVNWGQIEAAG